MSPSTPTTGIAPASQAMPGSVDEFAVAATLRRIALLLLAATAAFLSWMLGGTDASNQTPQAPAGDPSSGQNVNAHPTAPAFAGHLANH